MIQHLSVRVPWHDNDWKGTVCCRPEQNQACRVLRNIAERKNDEQEMSVASKPFNASYAYREDPPCVGESGSFMSSSTVKITVKHPYTYNASFKHISPTVIELNPFSFISRPYKWTLKGDDNGKSPHDLYFTKYNPEIEPSIGSNNWVSSGINQKNIFNYFYSNVLPNKSMAVAYAKAIPFIETTGRIIIGLGIITTIEEMREYKYSRSLTEEDITSYLWERQIGHSIRDDRNNGFLFPFKEIQNPDALVIIVPDEYFEEFSYATEHLSHDALIQVLNKTVSVLEKYIEIGLPHGNGSDWSSCIKWCKNKIADAWRERGTYPGLGAVLSVANIPYGFDIANIIRSKVKDSELWEKLPDILKNLDEYLPPEYAELADKISSTTILTFKSQFYNKKKSLLELLSRFALTFDQAMLLLAPEPKELKYASHITNIHTVDLNNLIIENPYILYEKTRQLEQKYRFGIGQIDLAIFPDKIIKELCPVPKPGCIKHADDKRRLRAIIVYCLEFEASKGNTLALLETIVVFVNSFRSDIDNLETKVLMETFLALDEDESGFLRELITKLEVDTEKSGQKAAFKLNRLIEISKVISNFVNARINAVAEIREDWNARLDEALDASKNQDDEYECLSHKEKIEALEKIAKSQISVLTGGAGTGKTTTLVALCMNERTNQIEWYFDISANRESTSRLEPKAPGKTYRP